jgi:hypothetical protein
MLIVPASKVSVPLTVVTLTAVNAETVLTFPAQYLTLLLTVLPNILVIVQALPVIFVIVAIPLKPSAAKTEDETINPVVKAVLVPPCVVAEPKYPLVTYVGVAPYPNWTSKLLVPLVLIPENITVTRFTYDGMLVKSMLVPDVDATAVAEVSPSIAPELIVTLADPSIVTVMPKLLRKC